MIRCYDAATMLSALTLPLTLLLLRRRCQRPDVIATMPRAGEFAQVDGASVGIYARHMLGGVDARSTLMASASMAFSADGYNERSFRRLSGSAAEADGASC